MGVPDLADRTDPAVDGTEPATEDLEPTVDAMDSFLCAIKAQAPKPPLLERPLTPEPLLEVLPTLPLLLRLAATSGGGSKDIAGATGGKPQEAAGSSVDAGDRLGVAGFAT